MIAEAVTGLSVYVGPAHAVRAAREIHASKRLEVVAPTLDDVNDAVDLLERYDARRLSYSDCVAFALMDRLRIKTAFTTDRRHFAGLARFTVIP